MSKQNQLSELERLAEAFCHIADDFIIQYSKKYPGFELDKKSLEFGIVAGCCGFKDKAEKILEEKGYTIQIESFDWGIWRGEQLRSHILNKGE